MPTSKDFTPFYLKDKVDRAIDLFAAKALPTQHDLNQITTAAKVQKGIDNYRAKAKNMTYDEFINEKHRSRRLAKMLARDGEPRPSKRCDAHAIVSGGHRFADTARGIMARFGMRIDDPDNGCWLPRGEEDKIYMPPHLRNAVAHNRIHREAYYGWLQTLINRVLIHDITDLTRTLKMVKLRLQSSALPSRIIPPVKKV